MTKFASKGGLFFNYQTGGFLRFLARPAEAVSGEDEATRVGGKWKEAC